MTVETDTYLLTSDEDAQAIIEQGFALRATVFADRLEEVSESHFYASDSREREDSQWFDDAVVFRGATALKLVMGTIPDTPGNRQLSKHFLRYVRSVTKPGALADHRSGAVRERIALYINSMRNHMPVEYALAMVQDMALKECAAGMK